MINFFKWIAVGVLVLIVIIAALFFHYLYVPSPKEPDLAGALGQHSVELNGKSRTFGWYKPKHINDGAALVFVLHGSKGSGKRMRSATAYEFDQLADKLGFIVVYPDGYQQHWNDCRRSADYAANIENIDDVMFFKTMIDFFSEEYAINQDRIFVTGMSNGGHMAYRLALESPELFMAFAPIAANLPVNDNLDCDKSGDAVSMAIFNGTDDAINPYNGGLVSVGGNSSRGEVMSTEDTVQYWLGLADIQKPALSTRYPEIDGLPHTWVTEQRWTSDKGKQVRLYTLVGSGHVIPSKITRFPRILGERAGDISAPEQIINFFMGLSKVNQVPYSPQVF